MVDAYSSCNRWLTVAVFEYRDLNWLLEANVSYTHQMFQMYAQATLKEVENVLKCSESVSSFYYSKYFFVKYVLYAV